MLYNMLFLKLCSRSMLLKARRRRVRTCSETLDSLCTLQKLSACLCSLYNCGSSKDFQPFLFWVFRVCSFPQIFLVHLFEVFSPFVKHLDYVFIGYYMTCPTPPHRCCFSHQQLLPLTLLSSPIELI